MAKYLRFSGPTGQASRRQSKSLRVTESAILGTCGCWAKTPEPQAGAGAPRSAWCCKKPATSGCSRCLKPCRCSRNAMGRLASPRRYSNSSGSARCPVRKYGRCPGGSAVASTLRSASSVGPKLLFLDEPTTGFDPEARRHSGTSSGYWQATARPSCLTTHYLEEAATLADRVAVIAGGRLVAVDSPEKLIGYASSAATVQWMEGDEIHVEDDRSPDRPDQAAVARTGQSWLS